LFFYSTTFTNLFDSYYGYVQDDLKKLIGQQPDLADTSQGKVAWRGDALNRVLGEEKPSQCMAWDLFQILIKFLTYQLQSALRI